MKIVVAGGSGFIGSALVARLVARGDEVCVLTRNPSRVEGARTLAWDGRTQGPWVETAAAADAIVNLAGANIGEGRWTESRKRLLVSSRLDATGALVEALRVEPAHVRSFVNASAVGYYGVRGDETLDESASRGGGFLARLSSDWETAARTAEPFARLTILRFGVVLEKDGGALAKMLPPFRLGGGGPIGSGRQWMSWVHRLDVVRLIEWAIDREDAKGVFNAVAPEPVRNVEFARSLGKALRRPAVLPIPGFALRLLFGDMADEVLLGGQRVVPKRAKGEGFHFEEPTLDGALRRIFGRG